MTYGSSHRMCESNVHTYSNPYASARLASSITRRAGGVHCSTTPNFMARTWERTASPLGPVRGTRAFGRGCAPAGDPAAPEGAAEASAASGGQSRPSARLREAEVDGGRGRVGPAAGDDLGPGEEADAVGAVHVGVAEQAGLPAAEAVVAHGHRDRHVDADHADLHLELELPGGAAVTGEDRRSVAERVVVDQPQPLGVAADAGDAEHRPEDLVVVRR